VHAVTAGAWGAGPSRAGSVTPKGSAEGAKFRRWPSVASARPVALLA